jgi:Nucleotide modification associated domain 3
MKAGLLIRVAIDSTAGNWNAPCSSDGRFCYVPMGSSDDLSEKHNYTEYQPFVEHLTKSVASAHKLCCWPSKLPQWGHFDPNFRYCTYGDAGRFRRERGQRGERIWNVLSDADHSFVVFYAGLREIESGDLCYSIIGFFQIKRIARVRDISKRDWHRNVHTDWPGRRANDVVIFGDTAHEQTGRLYNHIPIGSYRKRAWRVKKDLLRAWGGLDVRDGYIQRSFFLPRFLEPDSFLSWFTEQTPEFIRANNVRYAGA